MKKSLLLIVAVVMMSQVMAQSAQSEKSPKRFAVDFGFANRNYYDWSFGNNIFGTFENLSGLYLGANYQFEVAKMKGNSSFSVSAGLRYTFLGLGYTYSEKYPVEYFDQYGYYQGEGNLETKAKWRQHLISIPFKAQINISAGKCSLFVNAGPTFIIPLAYKTKIENTPNCWISDGIYLYHMDDHNINDFDDPNIDYKRFIVDFGFALGIDIDMIRIEAGYDFGLTKVGEAKSNVPQEYKNVKCKASTFRIGVSYLF